MQRSSNAVHVLPPMRRVRRQLPDRSHGRAAGQGRAHRNHCARGRVQQPMPTSREAFFAALFEAHVDALLAYARRRTEQLSDAEDVVAETFTVLWRRIEHVPTDASAHLPWLYGIARRVLANQRRAKARRQRLLDRVRSAFVPRRSSDAARDVAAALATLRPPDQEILRLAAWEGLHHAEIAEALGITSNAAAIRLHRARKRLSATMKGSALIRTSSGWKGTVSAVKRGGGQR